MSLLKWLFAVVVVVLLLFWGEIRGARSSMIDHEFEAFNSSRFRDRDILDSICSFPYDKDCIFSLTSMGDTVVLFKNGSIERVLWRSPNLLVQAPLSIAPPEAVDQEHIPSYSIRNSPAGTRDWDLLRGAQSEARLVVSYACDGSIENAVSTGDGIRFNFRGRSVSFLDEAGYLVGEWRHKRVVQGRAVISSNDGPLSLLVEFSLPRENGF